ncbi:amino acid permease [Diaphorobacter sp.]|uniref:amino acid permease n=1 Tax=Diaphorobacter sp. TaxID=1934310 RepID=UPI0028B168F7|nr:amino acid permease [Diaphorobacter sp.]
MANFNDIQQRETGLQQHLTSAQMVMIAIGGAVGTGLFMGSAFAIGFAGPAVLVSYAIGAFIALLLIGCLGEMTVAHPTSGSFGAYAEYYLSPLTGFVVRYAYWAALVLAVGMEVTAVGMYMAYWFPQVPQWVWVAVFSVILIGINLRSVKVYGAVEYTFSAIKVIAIVAFVLIGSYVVFGTRAPGIGFENYQIGGGFWAKGAWGMWLGVIVAMFSYLGVEAIAVAAGEAQHPQQAVQRAMKTTVLRLVLFYLLTLALMLAIVPWTDAATQTSPFVRVMQVTGIPGAAGVLNFVVLVAALSAMNSQLYTTSRMMFSLARAQQAPHVFGVTNDRGVPVAAILVSSLGAGVAMFINAFWPKESFVWMMSIAMFGAMFTWFMVFVTHLAFRRRRALEGAPPVAFRMWGFPWLTLLGAVLMGAVLLTTVLTPEFRLTLAFGLPWLLVLAVIYLVRTKR